MAHKRKFIPGREIVYQIFPDRWKKNDKVVQSKENNSFHGGTLRGITETIPYLKELGVTAIYLNPIFTAGSPHRYDTIDYNSIDPMLGTYRDYLELVETVHQNNMLLILDGVFNHTSHEHPWFKNPVSRRRYYIMKDKNKTMMWKDGNHLPKLDAQKPEVRKKILKVLDRWSEADGWRLDAAHLLPFDFLKEIKKKLCGKPIWIEDWHFAPQYAHKNLSDGVTNFLFRENIRTFFIEDSSPETFLERVSNLQATYPKRFLNMSWNFLGNHDTERFISIAGRERTFKAFFLLLTLPGIPMLYHGDEIGLSEKNVQEARGDMLWDTSKQDIDLKLHVKKLIEIRKKYNALFSGEFKPIFADNRSRTLIFEMRKEDESAVVGLNDGYCSCFVGSGKDNLKLNPSDSFIKIKKSGKIIEEFHFSSSPFANRSDSREK